MSAWLAEACIRRSQEILFLTFVLLHSLAVSPLRSSPFSSHKLNQSRGNRGKARRGKSLQTRSPLRRDSQQLETNAASVRQYSDRLADRLADWVTGVCLFTRKNSAPLQPTAPPPSCAQHPERFLFQTLSALTADNVFKMFGDYIELVVNIWRGARAIHRKCGLLKKKLKRV